MASSSYRKAASYQFKPVEERRKLEHFKQPSVQPSSEDKLLALKNYRRAKGLCLTCVEKYFKDHKCQSTVQLHVVQEMVEFLHHSPVSSVDCTEFSDDMELVHIADISPDDPLPEQSIVLQSTVQGISAIFLLDSGSNNSFLSDKISAQLTGHKKLTHPRRVKVVGGGILLCDSFIPNCQWNCGELKFCSSSRSCHCKAMMA